MNDFLHLVVTRYNLGLYTERRLTRTKAPIEPNEWMKHRFDIFRRFGYPSLAAQSNQDFTWYILLDEVTPKEHLEPLARLVSSTSNIRLYSSPKRSARRTLDYIVHEEHGDRPAYLLTTRIDNDDALHREAIARIQHAASQWIEWERGSLAIRRSQGIPTQDVIIDAPSGYVVHEDDWKDVREICMMTDRCTPYASYLSRSGVNVFHESHDKIRKYEPPYVAVDLRVPNWLQVVHRYNLICRLVPKDSPWFVQQVSEMPEGFRARSGSQAES
jgi:hypothetical protein